MKLLNLDAYSFSGPLPISGTKVKINVYQHFAVISVHEGRQNIADTPHIAHLPTASLNNGHLDASHKRNSPRAAAFYPSR